MAVLYFLKAILYALVIVVLGEHHNFDRILWITCIILFLEVVDSVFKMQKTLENGI